MASLAPPCSPASLQLCVSAFEAKRVVYSRFLEFFLLKAAACLPVKVMPVVENGEVYGHKIKTVN